MYLKLNVDGSFLDVQGTHGVVLRDDKGNWLWGFTGHCVNGNSSPLQPELMGIRVGLEAVLDRSLLRVLIKMYYAQAG